MPPIHTTHSQRRHPFLVALGVLGILCTGIAAVRGESPLQFETRTIDTEAILLWARVLGDVNDDGLTDILVQDNNGHGGALRWYETGANAATWTVHLIADRAPNGLPFAVGALDAVDILRLPSHDATVFEVLIKQTDSAAKSGYRSAMVR